MNKLLALCTIILIVCFVDPAHGQKSVSRIIPQADSPLKIVSYEPQFQKSSTYTREGIRHEVKYQNTSQKKIVAVQIGLTSFDIWNEFLDRTGGVSMRELSPGESEEGTWVATAYGDFSFYTGVCYVSKVRFEDGQIWSANLDKIAQELKSIEKDFDVSQLKKKETGTR